jgi:hypothetical protein
MLVRTAELCTFPEWPQVCDRRARITPKPKPPRGLKVHSRASLGLLPIAIGSVAPGREIERPMAIVISPGCLPPYGVELCSCFPHWHCDTAGLRAGSCNIGLSTAIRNRSERCQKFTTTYVRRQAARLVPANSENPATYL